MRDPTVLPFYPARALEKNERIRKLICDLDEMAKPHGLRADEILAEAILSLVLVGQDLKLSHVEMRNAIQEYLVAHQSMIAGLNARTLN
jgi:hypothetical protein